MVCYDPASRIAGLLGGGNKFEIKKCCYNYIIFTVNKSSVATCLEVSWSSGQRLGLLSGWPGFDSRRGREANGRSTLSRESGGGGGKDNFF